VGTGVSAGSVVPEASVWGVFTMDTSVRPGWCWGLAFVLRVYSGRVVRGHPHICRAKFSEIGQSEAEL